MNIQLVAQHLANQAHRIRRVWERTKHFQEADYWAQSSLYSVLIQRFYPGANIEPLPKLLTNSEVTNIISEAKQYLKGVDIHRVFQEVEDPCIDFYESFLSVYNPIQRKNSGVYYTPPAIARYMVQQTHQHLIKHFHLPLGLASSCSWAQRAKQQSNPIPIGASPDDFFVQILDPAAGTGSLLKECILLIYETMMHHWADANGKERQRKWSLYVRQKLLPRLFGIELLPTAIQICRLRLRLLLQKTGFRFQKEEYLRLFQGNSLQQQETSTALHQLIIKQPITVIIGNPPYRGLSSNTSSRIAQQMKEKKNGYYHIEGERIAEKKLWLLDDYVQFFYFAQQKLMLSGTGLLSYVSNHSYLSNPTFRAMRYQLLRQFKNIKILDLQGSVRNRSRKPPGCKDENLFAIEQGTAIAIFEKKNTLSPTSTIEHFDMWGSDKAARLAQSIPSISIRPKAPHYFFFPWKDQHQKEYQNYPSLIQLMPYSSTGMITARDSLVVGFTTEELQARISLFRDRSIDDEQIRALFFSSRKPGRYPPGDTRGWKLQQARQKLQADQKWMEHIQNYLYRPFDHRKLYHTADMIDWPRPQLSKELQPAGSNIALVVCKQCISPQWKHCLITDQLIDDSCVSNRSRERGYVFPLFLNHKKQSNFSQIWLDKLSIELQTRIQPQSLFAYICAILHSTVYRQRYHSHLQIDFPRIPLPTKKQLYQQLHQQGSRLIQAYLGKHKKKIGAFQNKGNSKVTQITFNQERQRLFINKESYFESVSDEIWKHSIGAFQVVQKWLTHRKRGKQSLNQKDIMQFQLILGALQEIQITTKEIDSLIESHGGYPAAFPLS